MRASLNRSICSRAWLSMAQLGLVGVVIGLACTEAGCITAGTLVRGAAMRGTLAGVAEGAGAGALMRGGALRATATGAAAFSLRGGAAPLLRTGRLPSGSNVIRLAGDVRSRIVINATGTEFLIFDSRGGHLAMGTLRQGRLFYRTASDVTGALEPVNPQRYEHWVGGRYAGRYQIAEDAIRGYDEAGQLIEVIELTAGGRHLGRSTAGLLVLGMAASAEHSADQRTVVSASPDWIAIPTGEKRDVVFTFATHGDSITLQSRTAQFFSPEGHPLGSVIGPYPNSIPIPARGLEGGVNVSVSWTDGVYMPPAIASRARTMGADFVDLLQEFHGFDGRGNSVTLKVIIRVCGF